MICFLDMDGVITDFEAAFKLISGGITSDQYRKIHGGASGELVLSRAGKDFWVNLDWIEGGKEVVDFALSHFKLVRILSSSGTGHDNKRYKEVADGKLQWLSENIPQIQKKNIIIVPFANLKAARHSGVGRILVDDKDSTIKNWNVKGGVGILHHHTSWKNTITELQSLSSDPIKLKEIVDALYNK